MAFFIPSKKISPQITTYFFQKLFLKRDGKDNSFFYSLQKNFTSNLAFFPKAIPKTGWQR